MADYPPKKNATFVFYVSLISQANTKIAQANPTLAAGDVKVATDDAAPSNLATLPVVDADFTKRVKVSMSAAEMNGDNVTIIFNDAAGAEWCDLTVNIQTVARQILDLAFPNVSARGIDVDASGGVEVGSFQAGAITAAAFGAGAIDNAAFNVTETLTANPAAGGIVAASFGAGAIDAAAIATDAIGAVELAAGAANKIADHVLRRTYANARASADGDAVNFRSLLGAIGKLVNKWAISGATLTVYQEDDTTSTAPGGTQTITATPGADPITTLDTT